MLWLAGGKIDLICSFFVLILKGLDIYAGKWNSSLGPLCNSKTLIMPFLKTNQIFFRAVKQFEFSKFAFKLKLKCTLGKTNDW